MTQYIVTPDGRRPMTSEEITDKDARVEEKRRQMREYHVEHCCCPECGGTNICSTTMGMLFPNKDTNRANCECGWSGIVDDMVPEKDNK